MNVWRTVGPAGLVLAALVLLAAAAPLIAPHDVAGLDLLRRLAPPAWSPGGSWTHPFGTDPLGRDVLSRVIYGARTSLAIAGAAMLVAAALGIFLGLCSGYAGSWLDALIMRVADIQLSFPYLLLAIAVMALLRPSLRSEVRRVG